VCISTCSSSATPYTFNGRNSSTTSQ
jgi:hypothetical protein